MGIDIRQALELNGDPQRRLLIKGACILSLDENVGNFACADILIDGSRIADIRPNIEADAIILDAADCIIVPGFIDTHRHCWQNVFRRFAPNAAITEYRESSNAIANVIEPEDVYTGNLLSCLGAIDAGITTMLDWSHISNTPEHSDAAVDGLKASRMRAVYGYAQARSGYPLSQYPDDIHRLRREFFPSDDGRVTLALGADIDRASNWAIARELGLRITSHVWRQNDLFEETGKAGLLGPDITFIHCTGLSDTSWKMMRDSGCTISIAPQSVMQLGVGGGLPPIQQALDHGIRPSISVDVEVCLPGDLFTQMRILMSVQRGCANERRLNGDAAAPALLNVQDILEFATVQGAKATGLSHRTGTLTPGKDADLIVLRADDINIMPLNNAVGTVVLGADRGNIRAVLVAGEILKWDGTLVGVDVDALQRRVTSTRDKLADAAGYPTDLVGTGVGRGGVVADPGRPDIQRAMAD
jgi:cytosine/adenosine deaminase-related metal-dependent hydrolase